MIITWDERKRQSNLLKHGLDFAELNEEFFLDASVIDAKERRFMAVGKLHGELIIAVVFAPLGAEALSIISMRKAAKKERSMTNG